MKKFLFIVFFLLIFCIGCTHQNNKTAKREYHAKGTTCQKRQVEKKQLCFEKITSYVHEKDVYCAKPIVVDTTNNNFHIRYKLMPNELIIQIDTIKYSDSSFYLEVDYKGKKIVPLKELRTRDFRNIVPLSETPEYEMCGLCIANITDSTVVFDVGFYIPDSDIGPTAQITVHSNGNITHKEIEVPIGD